MTMSPLNQRSLYLLAWFIEKGGDIVSSNHVPSSISGFGLDPGGVTLSTMAGLVRRGFAVKRGYGFYRLTEAGRNAFYTHAKGHAECCSVCAGIKGGKYPCGCTNAAPPACGCGCGAPAGTCKFSEARLKADDLCVCGHAKKFHGSLPFVGACHSGIRPCAGKCSSYIQAPSAMQPGFMAPSERR